MTGQEDGKASDFLRKVESIFAEDIAGTPVSSLDRSLTNYTEDIAEVADQLEKIGFRTPNIYSAKSRTVDRSLRHMDRLSLSTRDKVTSFLEVSDASKTRGVSTLEKSLEITRTPVKGGGDTPVHRDKSYLRQTLASSRKRILAENGNKTHELIHKKSQVIKRPETPQKVSKLTKKENFLNPTDESTR